MIIHAVFFLIGCALGTNEKSPSPNAIADALLLAFNQNIIASDMDSFPIPDFHGNFYPWNINSTYTLRNGKVQGVATLRRKGSQTKSNILSNGIKSYTIEAEFGALALEYNTAEIKNFLSSYPFVWGSFGNISLLLQFQSIDSHPNSDYEFVYGNFTPDMKHIGLNITTQGGNAAKLMRIALQKVVKDRNSELMTLVGKYIVFYVSIQIPLSMESMTTPAPAAITTNRIITSTVQSTPSTDKTEITLQKSTKLSYTPYRRSSHREVKDCFSPATRGMYDYNPQRRI